MRNFLNLSKRLNEVHTFKKSLLVHKIKNNFSELQQLKKFSIVVADTSDFNLLQKYQPQDSTTNPSLILQAAQSLEFQALIHEAIEFSSKNLSKYAFRALSNQTTWNNFSDREKQQFLQLVKDKLSVIFGCNILKKIPGYVSTQVDARLSYNTRQTVQRAIRLINLYQNAGISRQRILIKIAATWQGIKAGKELLNHNIKSNMTLIFHKCQAIACAQNQLFLISPFVGRILDWHKKQTGSYYNNPSEDPGVKSVTQIYNYFKKFNHKTIIMGASFRNTSQIKQLAGCDRLTIAPKLLNELQIGQQQVFCHLSQQKAKKQNISQIIVTQSFFQEQMNNSKMATQLLRDGINKFEQDGYLLTNLVKKFLCN